MYYKIHKLIIKTYFKILRKRYRMPWNTLELWTLDREELLLDKIFFESSFAAERTDWVQDIAQETLYLFMINNLNMLEAEGMIDFSFIIGNLIDLYLAGFLAVYSVWYRAARTNLFVFWMVLWYSFVHKNQYFLLLLTLLELLSILFRTMTLPNRLTINLLAGSLIVLIISTQYITNASSIAILLMLNLFGIVITFYEMYNAGLQLFIFVLLTADYDSGLEVITG